MASRPSADHEGASADVAETGTPEYQPDPAAGVEQTALDLPEDQTAAEECKCSPDIGSEEVLDPTADSDFDGVPDLQELADGTDPANPASATAWHPELDSHPRLFFTSADLPALAERMKAQDGPRASLAKRIEGIAAQTPPEYPEGLFDVKVSPQLGAIAEASAFIGLVEADQAATEKALAAMTAPFPDPSGLDVESRYDLYESEALVSFCTAWDYLAGTPMVGEAKLMAARENLVKRIDAFRWMSHEGSQFWMLYTSRNNHPMKVFGALGLCAMALNDRPEAAQDISEAMTGLDFLLNLYQGNTEGGYAEGWNYLVYGGNSYLPFLLAYHRWAKGKTLPYFGVPIIQAESPYLGKVAPIQDFAVNPTTRAVFDRALWSTRPDGLMPDTDDANPASLHGAVLAALFDDPDYLWQWFKPAGGFQAGRMETATLATYDGTLPPPNPSGEIEGSAIEAGFAIFRESWAPDAVYLVLQGEHGGVRVHGEGHEHPDELSFLLHAHGQALIIDPGYINWDNHDKVKYSTDHNTILVDGKGSPFGFFGEFGGPVGADAWLTPMKNDGPFTQVAVSASYEGVAFVRRITRVAGKLFVIDDHMGSAGVVHEYTWLLNGMGGGDVPGSSFQLTERGARWEVGGAWIEVVVVPTVGMATYGHDLEEHATTWGSWAMHERLAAKASMGQMAGFLSIVIPRKSGGEFPVTAVGSVKDGLVTVAVDLGEDEVLASLNMSPKAEVTTKWGKYIDLKQGLTVAYEAGGEVKVGNW